MQKLLLSLIACVLFAHTPASALSKIDKWGIGLTAAGAALLPYGIRLWDTDSEFRAGPFFTGVTSLFVGLNLLAAPSDRRAGGGAVLFVLGLSGAVIMVLKADQLKKENADQLKKKDNSGRPLGDSHLRRYARCQILASMSLLVSLNGLALLSVAGGQALLAKLKRV